MILFTRRTTWRNSSTLDSVKNCTSCNIAKSDSSDSSYQSPASNISRHIRARFSCLRPLLCPGSLESGQDDDVRQHAQLGPQGGVSRPQDVDAAAHPSHGQWVSLMCEYFVSPEFREGAGPKNEATFQLRLCWFLCVRSVTRQRL